MDVKVGNGAFADTQPMAAALANSIVAVAEGAGLSSVALVTDMNQPLGQAAGNALEVADCIELLTGGTGDRRFCEVTLALAEEMLLRGGFAGEAAVARAMAKDAIDPGRAAARLGAMGSGGASCRGRGWKEGVQPGAGVA